MVKVCNCRQTIPEGCEDGLISVQGQNYFVQQLQIRQARTKMVKGIYVVKIQYYPAFSSSTNDKDANKQSMVNI